jgi:hypothetical protein
MGLVASRYIYVVSKLGAVGNSTRHFELTVREWASVGVEEWKKSKQPLAPSERDVTIGKFQ